MNRTVRRVVGGVLLSIPFLFVFWMLYAVGGLAVIAIFLGGMAVFFGCIIGGVALLDLG